MLPSNSVLESATIPPGARTITEASATVLYAGKDAVFYNKVQVLNRDLSISVIRTFDKWLRRHEATPKDVKRAWTRCCIRDEVYKSTGGSGASSSSGATVASGGCTSNATSGSSSNSGGNMSSGAAAGGAESSSGSSRPRLVPAVPSRRDFGSDALTTLGSPHAHETEMPGLRILEALSASGLRSVRYAREIPGIDHIITNDMDPAAAASIAVNADFNGLPQRLVQPCQADATLLMYLCRDHHNAFDVVDVDPYGSASPFLDGALQCVADGGLLAITCTDMAVLAGNAHPDVCHAKYGCLPVKGQHVHEQALRLVLGAIEGLANRHKKSITPLLSVSVDFYIRMFVRVHTSATEANNSSLQLGALHQCSGCGAFWTQPRGERAHRGGRADAASRLEGARASGQMPAAVVEGVPQPQEGGDGDSAAAASSSAAAVGAATGEAPAPKRTKLSRDAPASSSSSSSAAGKPGPIHASRPAPIGPHCPMCQSVVHSGGPLWLGRLHDPAFASRVLGDMTAHFGTDGRGVPVPAATDASAPAPAGAPPPPPPTARFYDLSRAVARPAHDAGSNDVDTVATSRRRLMGLLRSVCAELPDAPLYFDPAGLASMLHMPCPSLPALHSALASKGYAFSGSHAAGGVVKTAAPASAWLGILREWEARPGHGANPISKADPRTVAHAVLVRGPAAPGGAWAGDLGAAHRAPAPASSSAAAASGGGSSGGGAAEEPEGDLFRRTGEFKRAQAEARAAGPRFVSNPLPCWGPASRASAQIAENIRVRLQQEGEAVEGGGVPAAGAGERAAGGSGAVAADNAGAGGPPGASS